MTDTSVTSDPCFSRSRYLNFYPLQKYNEANSKILTQAIQG
jgi:hypothetical protein